MNKIMLFFTSRCKRHKNKGTERPSISAPTWGGLKWGVKDVCRVSELRDGGTLETSVLRRDTSTCEDLFSATFEFPLCFFSSVSTEKNQQEMYVLSYQEFMLQTLIKQPCSRGQRLQGTTGY